MLEAFWLAIFLSLPLAQLALCSVVLMVGFGTCKKQAVEDYGSYKENKHMQPRSAANPNTVDASLADPLHAAGKPNMRDYVDSMDTAFPAGARSHAQSEGKHSTLDSA